MLVWPGCLYNYHRDTLACTLGGLFCGELLLLAGTILLARARRGQGTAPFSKRTRLLLGVGVPALVATAAFLIVGRAFLAGFGADDWAGGRGVLYRATCQAFAELPLGRKLIGVGPDCYGALADNSPVMAAQLYPIFQELRMTNAHCEPLNRLVTTGIFDTLFFYGFLLACALRGFRVYRAAKTPAGLAVVLLAASYVTNSLVSFEQVLSTPYLFLTLGLLAGYLRGVQSVD